MIKRICVLLILIVPQFVFGWGRTGHIIVAKVGSQLPRSGTQFWRANVSNMMMLTVVPDLNWKELPTNPIEKPTHFFQPDSYFNDPSQFSQIPTLYSQAVSKFGKEFVDKNGSSVWRVPQFYLLALQALKAGDLKRTVEMAGVMSHYVGDISQPLHDTHNYDGQETGQVGIHKFFETTNIEDGNQDTLVKAVQTAALALLNNPKYVEQFKGPMELVMFRETARAFSFKETLLKIDREQGRTGQGAMNLKKLAIDRMADGAASLAVLLTRMWDEAGNPNAAGSVSINVPAWVEPQYATMAMRFLSHNDFGPTANSCSQVAVDDCAE